MSCPERHHECIGTFRIERAAKTMGISAKARHYFEPEFVTSDGETMPAEWTYEARAGLRYVTLDPDVVDSADPQMTEAIVEMLRLLPLDTP